MSNESEKSWSLDKAQIARQFSRSAGTYDQVSQLQQAMSQRLIELLPANPTGCLVDFGCGTGESLIALAQATRLSLIGLDIATGMIEVAKKKIANEGLLSRIELRTADFDRTGLAEESVDLVFSNAAIQWTGLGTVIKEMKRILRPRGQIMVSTFGLPTLGELREAWVEIGDQQTRVHNFVSGDEIEQALTQVGLAMDGIVTERVVIAHQSVDEFLKSLKRLGATNADVSRSSGMLGRAKYLRLYCYLKNRLKLHGKLELTFEPIYFTATRRV